MRRRAGNPERPGRVRAGWPPVWLAHAGHTSEAQAQLREVLQQAEIAPGQEERPSGLLLALLEAAVLLGDRATAALIAPMLEDKPNKPTRTATASSA